MIDYSRGVDLDGLGSYKIKKVDWVSRYGYKINSFSFRPSAIEQVLLGDHRYVTHMFYWAEGPKELYPSWTPCHADFWSRNPKPLNEEQKAFLKWLIRDEIKDEGE